MTEEEQVKTAIALAAESTKENVSESVSCASGLSTTAWCVWAYLVKDSLGLKYLMPNEQFRKDCVRNHTGEHPKKAQDIIAALK